MNEKIENVIAVLNKVKGFEKITKEEDRINFELDTIGRYYIFELTLSRVVNGNLETTPSNEVEFFSAELDDSY